MLTTLFGEKFSWRFQTLRRDPKWSFGGFPLTETSNSFILSPKSQRHQKTFNITQPPKKPNTSTCPHTHRVHHNALGDEMRRTRTTTSWRTVWTRPLRLNPAVARGHSPSQPKIPAAFFFDKWRFDDDDDDDPLKKNKFDDDETMRSAKKSIGDSF